jgi:hypothetical protein
MKAASRDQTVVNELDLSSIQVMRYRELPRATPTPWNVTVVGMGSFWLQQNREATTGDARAAMEGYHVEEP